MNIKTNNVLSLLRIHIALCGDGSYYTGITNNLSIRFKQHQEGANRNRYTFKRRPLELKFKQ
ncbi:MAG: GIY-YIG nuclease family protein, partial [Marinirhabdus sp.]